MLDDLSDAAMIIVIRRNIAAVIPHARKDIGDSRSHSRRTDHGQIVDIIADGHCLRHVDAQDLCQTLQTGSLA